VDFEQLLPKPRMDAEEEEADPSIAGKETEMSNPKSIFKNTTNDLEALIFQDFEFAKSAENSLPVVVEKEAMEGEGTDPNKPADTPFSPIF
jgi:hypothetical protein